MSNTSILTGNIWDQLVIEDARECCTNLYLFLKIYVTSEGVVFLNVLYYQQLSIACYQVSFYANNYCE